VGERGEVGVEDGTGVADCLGNCPAPQPEIHIPRTKMKTIAIHAFVFIFLSSESASRAAQRSGSGTTAGWGGCHSHYRAFSGRVHPLSGVAAVAWRYVLSRGSIPDRQAELAVSKGEFDLNSTERRGNQPKTQASRLLTSKLIGFYTQSMLAQMALLIISFL
jgi:hypothetical protein